MSGQGAGSHSRGNLGCVRNLYNPRSPFALSISHRKIRPQKGFSGNLLALPVCFSKDVQFMDPLAFGVNGVPFVK